MARSPSPLILNSLITRTIRLAFLALSVRLLAGLFEPPSLSPSPHRAAATTQALYTGRDSSGGDAGLDMGTGTVMTVVLVVAVGLWLLQCFV